MSKYNIAGSIQFKAAKTGKRAGIEADANKIALELCLYAQQKYPGYVFDCPGLSISQPLSEQVQP